MFYTRAIRIRKLDFKTKKKKLHQCTMISACEIAALHKRKRRHIAVKVLPVPKFLYTYICIDELTQPSLKLESLCNYRHLFE